VNRDTASQQIRASTDPFGHGRSRTQITQFSVESGGYLGNPDCRTERRLRVLSRPQLGVVLSGAGWRQGHGKVVK
jgi:hypothetical protein